MRTIATALLPALLLLGGQVWRVCDASDSVGDMLAQALAGAISADAPPQAASPVSDVQKLMLALASVAEGAGGKGDGAAAPPSLAIRKDLGKSLLTPEIAQRLLDLLNYQRSLLGRGLVDGVPSASNMQLLKWDDRLESSARDWACQCIAKADTPANRAVSGLTYVAQNVAAGWLPDPGALVGEWLDQRQNWDPAGGCCRPERRCEEFRRLAAASARFVGCALHDCHQRTGFAALLVCNFAGGADPTSSALSPPYAPGPGCRACPAAACKCLLGLCASRKACEAAGAADACTEAPCFDSPDCPSPQQQPASAYCRSDAAVSLCPRLCGACGAPVTDANYRPENAAKIVARVIALGAAPSSGT